MRNLIARYRRRAFVRNVAVLATGTAIAQVLTVGVSPILARLFDPVAFGVLAVIASLAAPLGSVACARYELAVVLAKEDEDAANLLAVSLLFACAMSVLAFIVTALAGDWIASKMDTPEVGLLIYFMPLMVMIGGISVVATYWNTRRQTYVRQSVAEVSRAVSVAGIQIAGGLAKAGPWALVFGRFAGSMIVCAVLAIQIYREDGKLIVHSLNLKRMKELAREHDSFPKYNVPRAVLLSLSNDFPNIFLALIFSPAVAGLYWFSYRLLRVPTTLFGQAVRRVFYQRAVDLYHERRSVQSFLAKTSLLLMAVGTPPTVIVVAFGPALFEVVFGAQWREAGVYAQWLVVWWFTSFSAIPCAMVVPIYRLQPLLLASEVVALAARMITIWLAAEFADALTAIAWYSVLGAVFNLLIMAYVFRYVRRH